MTGRDWPVRDFRGHFRMYLMEELIAVGEAAGLEVVEADYVNEFAYQHRRGQIVERLVRILPERFDQQLVVVFRRPV